MANEFKALKELATVSATVSEPAGVNSVICSELDSADFRSEYDSLLQDVVNTYQVVIDIIEPLMALNDRSQFDSQFAELSSWYAQHYQKALSQPRINAEFTYEKYLQFRKRKEVATGYPLLKVCFTRLHDFIDKWIDNDIWLAMCIDTLLKMLNLQLHELQDVYRADKDEAWMLFCAGPGRCAPYLKMIEDNLSVIAQTGIRAEKAA